MPMDEGKCIIQGCKNRASSANWAASKGLCDACYRDAKKAIDAGQTTWDRLAALGLTKTEETPFQKAFKEANSREQGG